MTKKKIVIGALWYSITAAAEYIYRAFKRRSDCEVISVGPAFSNWMPWSSLSGNIGVIMPDKYIFTPDIVIPQSNVAPISFVEGQLPDGFIPDLWLDVNAGFYLDGTPKHGEKAMFLTDPHTGLRQLYDSVRHQYRYYFNPQTVYSKPDEIYLPYAADSEWHRPMTIDKEYQAILLGNIYPNRVDLVNTLRSMGYNIKFELGIGKDDATIEHNKSYIGLNWSSMQDCTARVWEIMGCGLIPIINRVPDLPLFFQEGVHYLGFDTKEQAIARVVEVINDLDNYKEMGIRAHNNIVENGHFWDNRVQTMLESCKLV